ncbi:MAG: hypothetical protein R3E58_08485 [Phycisphaerae bacterium]|nr:hypothetical protein [Phycisphaerales bacterium]
MRNQNGLPAVIVAACFALGTVEVVAQEAPEDAARVRNFPTPTGAALRGVDPPSVTLSTNGLPHVMITGYWPPTNEMLRQWSQDPFQNSNGWVGENWEGRGYNIYAFFPEFPGGTGTNPKGDGDFEVDYQDTSNDWWPLVETIRPIAIITFSRANTANGWELEGGNRTYSSSVFPTWSNDYLVPLKPTAELPSFDETPETERFSTLPIDAIITEVVASGANVDPFSTVIDTGRFLSNYIGYHGNWYHELHADKADPFWNIAGGHIHVGSGTNLPDAVQASEVTLRVLTAHLDARLALVEDQDGDGDVDLTDYNRLAACLSGPNESTLPVECGTGHFPIADIDNDGDVDLADAAKFQLGFTGS